MPPSNATFLIPSERYFIIRTTGSTPITIGNDDYNLVVQNDASTINVFLPSLVTQLDGSVVAVIPLGVVNLIAAAGDTINGLSSYPVAFANTKAMTFVANKINSSWLILGSSTEGGGPPSTTAIALATNAAPVNVNVSAPPTTGQVLRATSATNATWQDIPDPASATPLNTPDTIVKRAPTTGNFAAGVITGTGFIGPLTGNVTGNVSGSAATFTGNLVGDITGTQITTLIANGAVTNAKISASAAIEDTKLATIGTAGKVANSATTATSTNTADTIILRGASGNFSAGTATLTGVVANTATIPTLNSTTITVDTLNATTINGTVSTAVNFTGSLVGEVTGTQDATVIANSVITNAKIAAGAGIVDTKLATISTAGKVLNSATSALSTNTANAIVTRDASGNFSANIITASLNGNAATATSTTNFSGGLSGDVTGTQSATVLSDGVVTNAKVAAGAAIVDTKLATISTAGKVANSATSATAANTNGSIVLRDTVGGTTMPNTTIAGNLTMFISGQYSNINVYGGTSNGYIYTNPDALGDGINFGYNLYYPSPGSSASIPASSLATSRITAANGRVSICAGAINAVAIEYLRIDSGGQISTQNGAIFVGNLSGSATSFSGSLSGDVTGTQSATVLADGTVTNAKIAAGAAIVDTKLATISTAGKVANSATSALTTNTGNAIVVRDNVNGGFSAGTVNLVRVLTTVGTAITGGIQLLSGNSANFASLTVGRTAAEYEVGVVASVGQFATGSVAGDIVIRSISGTRIMFGIGTTSYGTITSAGFTGAVVGNVTGNVSGSAASFTGSLSGDVTGTQSATVLADNTVTNAKIVAGAGIVDTKLATISTAGKVLNTATTATANNTNDAIVARDSSGNFAANIITATLSGNATTATTSTNFSGSLSGDITGTQSATVLADNTVTNAKIVAGAGIVDTKLATISTAGKVLNSATSALSTNTANAIVTRDASGNFSANVITASLNGNASTATTSGSFTGSLSGDVTGTQSATVLADGTVTNAKVAAGAAIVDTKLATISTAGKVLNSATSALSTNTANAIVTRDASGNFSANVITASLNGNASTATSTTSFTGSLSGDVTGTQSATVLADGTVTNAKVASGAAIVDTKLATISTAGKVLNSATSAQSTNTANAIVTRDASGNFSAGTISLITVAVNTGAATTGGIALLSGNSANFASFTIGRAAADYEVGAVASNGQFSSGSTTGDVVIRNNNIGQRIIFGVGTTTYGTISTAGFTGNVVGNLTGNVTGNVSGSAASFTGSLSGDVTGTQSATSIANNAVTTLKILDGAVTNAKIVAAAGIDDTKLATIATAGKVSNSATTATTAATNNTIMLRDATNGFTNLAYLITNVGLAPHHYFSNASSVVRWSWGLVNTESGSNTGADIVLRSFTDAGAALASPLTFTRSTGNAVFTGTITAPTFIGNLTGNASGSAASFTGSLSGDVTGTQSTTLIANNAVTTAKILDGSITDAKVSATAAIVDTKLAQIVTANKVANSATSAQSANTANAIVTRDASGNFAASTITATGLTTSTITGNIAFSPAAGNTYSYVSFIGGTTFGYIFGNQPVLGQGIHQSYNFYVNPSGDVSTIPSAVTGTSRISVGSSSVVLATGATNTAPTSKLLVDTDIRAQNGATFIGNLTGNVTGNATSTTNFSGSLAGDVTGTQSATVIAAGAVDNSKISASAGIVDTKLATISTTGKVLNSATSAQSTNTANAIVTRDASGNFSAGTITATLSGSATNFSGSLSGDVTGTQSATVIAAGAVDNNKISASAGIVDTKLATISTAGKVANSATSATTAATNNTIMLRDATNGFTNLAYLITNVGLAPHHYFSNASSVVRWSWGLANAESGSNTGADIQLRSFNDAGTALATPLTFTRSTGNAVFTGTVTAPTFIGNLTGTASSATNFSGSLAGDVTGTQSATVIAAGAVDNNKISASAGIVDTKLATIATAGKVSNSATSATTAATNNTIMLRDATSGFTNLAYLITNVGLAPHHYFSNASSVVRWSWGLAGTESGTNSGANIQLRSFDDAGAALATPLAFTRSTSAATFSGSVAVSLAAAVTGGISLLSGASGNFASMTIGRTAAECEIAVAASGGQFLSGAVAGDVCMRNNNASNAIRFGTGTTTYAIINSSGITASLTGNVTGNVSGSAASFTGSLSGNVTGTQSATVIANNVITNAMVNSAAAIADTKLATISSSGKVSNSATSAQSTNTANAIATRDANGDFAARYLTLGGLYLGGSSTLLNWYQEVTVNPFFIGPWTGTVVVPINFVKIGKIVTMNISPLASQAIPGDGPNTITTAADTIPSGMLPIGSPITTPFAIKVRIDVSPLTGMTNVAATLQINSDGSILIFLDQPLQLRSAIAVGIVATEPFSDSLDNIPTANLAWHNINVTYRSE